MEKDKLILKSAKDFLIESLRNYQQGRRVNFAILHAVTATELLLKSRLIRIHESLIYKNIDAPNFTNEPTIGLRNLPQRLLNLGVTISADDCELIKKVSEWRNQIVHYMPLYSHDLAISHLARLYNLIATFLRTEFKTTLKSFLPKELFRPANGLIKEWDSIMADAQKEAAKEGNVAGIICPDCGTQGSLCERKNRQEVFCHLCEEKHTYGKCIDCGRMETGARNPTDPEDFLCDRCLNKRMTEDLEDYGEMLGEIERGK